MHVNATALESNRRVRAKWQEKLAFYDRGDGLRSEIEGLASGFHGGKPCRVVEIFEGAFIHCFRLRFDMSDHADWLLRFHIPGDVMYPTEKIDQEVAVMKFIREKTRIPIPKVIASGRAEGRFAGLGPFIIMEFVEGERLDETLYQNDEIKPEISQSTLKFIYNQMAQIYLELFEHDFDQIVTFPHDYIKRTTIKYNLDRDVQLNTAIKSAIWDDATKKWKIKADFEGGIIENEADILVNGSGILKDENCNWDGKRVQKTAKKVVNYVRSPTWISSNYASQYTKDGKNFEYTEEQKREFREKPKVLHEMRHNIEHGFNQFFYALLNDSPQQATVHENFSEIMIRRLNGRKDLIDKLVPDWKVGCRRLTPGDGYLEAIQEVNTECDFDPILRITDKDIETVKGIEEFDIIIAATGFDVSFKPNFELIGANGRSL
ncbi:hypothetical protein VE02_06608 [Pseudogymnoascus sp. 03VT05]|nr:hypothetical protein VE02_06608 [Pseudogymnoascus sp. 03VT05]